MRLGRTQDRAPPGLCLLVARPMPVPRSMQRRQVPQCPTRDEHTACRGRPARQIGQPTQSLVLRMDRPGPTVPVSGKDTCRPQGRIETQRSAGGRSRDKGQRGRMSERSRRGLYDIGEQRKCRFSPKPVRRDRATHLGLQRRSSPSAVLRVGTSGDMVCNPIKNAAGVVWRKRERIVTQSTASSVISRRKGSASPISSPSSSRA